MKPAWPAWLWLSSEWLRVAKPKLEIDEICDSAYMRFTKKQVFTTDIKKNGIIVDYDRQGWLVGIEFLNLAPLIEMLNDTEITIKDGSDNHE